MRPAAVRVAAAAAAGLAFAAMAGALAVTGGRNAELVRVEAARQEAIEQAAVPGMRTSYLASTVVDRLDASRRARQRAAAEAQAAAAGPVLQQSWRDFGASVFPHERPDVRFEALRQPPFGRTRALATAPAWNDVRGSSGGGERVAQSAAALDAWPRSGWAPTASTVVGVSSATPTR